MLRRLLRSACFSRKKRGRKTVRKAKNYGGSKLLRRRRTIFSAERSFGGGGKRCIFLVQKGSFSAISHYRFSHIHNPPPTLPLILARRHFEREGGGMYISNPTAAGFFLPPLFYTPPTPRFIRADFWEGDATKHFSVKKRGFQ